MCNVLVHSSVEADLDKLTPMQGSNLQNYLTVYTIYF